MILCNGKEGLLKKLRNLTVGLVPGSTKLQGRKKIIEVSEKEATYKFVMHGKRDYNGEIEKFGVCHTSISI